jgi:hypothetical protein
MGLDMYLFKTKKVEGLTGDEYNKVANCVYNNEEDLKNGAKLKDLIPEIKNVDELQESIVERGNHFKWLSIFEEVGYWRKANSIHNWFVKNCQNGIDECQLSNEVTEKQLKELLSLCNDVLMGTKNPKKTLPTASGFFFGGTGYDNYYIEDMKNTIEIISEVLNKTDFEKEIIFYNSSW